MLAPSARRRSPAARVVVPALAVAALVAGCGGTEQVAPEPEPTPIAELETAGMQVPRIDFCALVPQGAVTAALDGEAASDSAYGNGDEAEVRGAGTDVVHEVGCTWTGPDGATARAWVFAPPVTPAFVRTVVLPGSRAPGCRIVDGPDFGRPSLTQECRLAGDEQRVRHAGLFGRTWLSCEVAAAGAEVADLRTRAGQWCVAVAGALDTRG